MSMEFPKDMLVPWITEYFELMLKREMPQMSFSSLIELRDKLKSLWYLAREHAESR